MPTATLDTSNIDQVRADAQARLDELHLDWLPGVVSDLLVRLRTRLDDGQPPHRSRGGAEGPPGADHRRRRAAPHLRGLGQSGQRARRGHERRARPDGHHRHRKDQSGGLGDGQRLPRPLSRRRQQRRDRRDAVGRDGDARRDAHHLCPRAAAQRPPRTPRSCSPSPGSISIGDQTKSTSFDFEVVNKSVRFRVPADGGDAIVTVGTTLGIQGANAGFSCDLTTLTCQKSS